MDKSVGCFCMQNTDNGHLSVMDTTRFCFYM